MVFPITKTSGATLINIILALVALGVLVTVHETGHFFAARLCGVGVEVFSIGFGRPILKLKRKGIEYKIGWLPLGGYVRMKGEDPESGQTADPDSFQLARWWKKIVIAASGPFSNFLFAALIFVIAFLLPGRVEDHYPVVGQAGGLFEQILAPGDSILSVNGKPVRGWYDFAAELVTDKPNQIIMERRGLRQTLTLPQVRLEELLEQVQPAVSSAVGEVSPGLPAWNAGLRTGDVIVKVDTVRVRDWFHMRELITGAGGDSVKLTILRGAALHEKTLPLQQNPMSDGRRMIGITQLMPVSYVQSYKPGEAVKNGISATLGFVAVNYTALYQLVSRPHQIKDSVGGPVMIYSLSSQSARKGVSNWLMFVAAISLVLMIMNLLPIPVLDGGHVLFALIQAVTGKPIPRRVQAILQNIGLALLLLLMGYAFYSDLKRVLLRAMSSLGRP